MKKLINIFLAIIVSVIGVSVTPITAFADDETDTVQYEFQGKNYDETDVDDDLVELFGSVDNAVTEGQRQQALYSGTQDWYLITVAECGFSPETSENGSTVFGSQFYEFYLYFYCINTTAAASVYSPGYSFFCDIAVDTDKVFNYCPSYKLEFLSASYHGIYKFKVSHDPHFNNVLGLYDEACNWVQYKNDDSRPYYIKRIYSRLNNTGFPSSFIERTFTFSGYSSGFCGNNAASLVCAEDATVLHLSVNPVYYTATESNGKNQYTVDRLHSVYFSIPNSVIESYGEASAFQATWLNAILKPMLVTGNSSAFDELHNYVGVDIESMSQISRPTYCYLGVANEWHQSDQQFLGYGYSYNKYTETNRDDCHVYYGDVIPLLAGVFYSGSGANSADSFCVSPDVVKNVVTYCSEGSSGPRLSAIRTDGTLYRSNYDRDLFESVDSRFVMFDTASESETPLNLTFGNYTQNLWQRMTGNYSYNVSAYENVEFIKRVQSTDLSGNNSVVAQSLYVDEQFVDELRNALSNDSTLYLLRYKVSDYTAQEAVLYEPYQNFFGYTLFRRVDTNAYFFQEACDLQFEIINATFRSGDVYTTLDVSMIPIDIFHGSEPPLVTTPDKVIGSGGCNMSYDNGSDFLNRLISFICLLLFVVVFVAAFGKLYKFFSHKRGKRK